MSNSKTPWLGLAFAGMIAAFGSDGCQDREKYAPAPSEHVAEKSAKDKLLSLGCPVMIRVMGDTVNGYKYTFYITNPHFNKYLEFYKSVRLEVSAPESKIEFNETYDLARGERARWRPVEETSIKVSTSKLGMVISNVPKEALIGIYGKTDSGEEQIYADKAKRTWRVGTADLVPKGTIKPEKKRDF